MELAELTVRGFTEEIASASPAPGGGSAAALAGAVGAALTAMVSGLTLGRKKYEAVQELALRAQAQADVLRKRLLAAMEQDTQAFLQVSAAYAMPKQTLEEKQARETLIWGRVPDLAGLGLYFLVAVVVAWGGFFWFQKTRKGFADVL